MIFKHLKHILKTVCVVRNISLRVSLQSAFGKHLLLTNTVSSGLLMFVGDLVQQEFEYQRHMLPQRYDWARLIRLTIVGFGFGPIHHYFYLGLDKVWPLRDVTTITKKILMDQFLMSPVCIAFFFYAAGLLELKTFKECTNELTEKAIHVYTVDWCVWPPTQFINFYYLPVKYQVLYINFITMLYNVFLSYMKHKEVANNYLKEFTRKNN